LAANKQDFAYYCPQTQFAEGLLHLHAKVIGLGLMRFLNLLFTELGTSLFEIAQSLFTLERTLILGANEQFKQKSEEQ